MKKQTLKPKASRKAPADLKDDQLEKVVGGAGDIIKMCEAPDLIRPEELTDSTLQKTQLIKR